MNMESLYGILIPFLGTSLGAGCVFLCGNRSATVFSGR